MSTPHSPNPASLSGASGTTFRVVLVKGNHSWRFEWDDGCESQLLSALTSLACDPGTNFDWSDLAVLRRHIHLRFNQSPRKERPKSDDLI